MTTTSFPLMAKLRRWAGARNYNLISFMLSALDRIQHERRVRRHQTSVKGEGRHAKILAALRRDGFYVWEDFSSGQEVSRLRETIDALVKAHPECIHSGSSNDKRIFGVENLSELFVPVSRHAVLADVAASYLGEPSRTAFSLGARLDSLGEKLGSGGGWHRDSNLPQLKSMLYLSDVGEENGPFQLVSQSHHFLRANMDNFVGQQAYGKVRYGQETIDRILHRRDPALLRTFTGKAGTLIIFDSSTLHRGMPIKSGVRYAITNYFYPERSITNELYQHFSPVAGFAAMNDT